MQVDITRYHSMLRKMRLVFGEDQNTEKPLAGFKFTQLQNYLILTVVDFHVKGCKVRQPAQHLSNPVASWIFVYSESF